MRKSWEGYLGKGNSVSKGLELEESLGVLELCVTIFGEYGGYGAGSGGR